ncbi:MAG: hypothetical protein ACI81V_001432, partial [Lentimonas sp.]
ARGRQGRALSPKAPFADVATNVENASFAFRTRPTITCRGALDPEAKL